MGTLHLYLTYGTIKFQTRDAELTERMKQVPLIMSKQTTVWKAWIGFNASHSMGAMIYGLIFAYLAAFHYTMLIGSAFLIFILLGTSVCYVIMARHYWFSSPFRGLSAALTCLVCGVVLAYI